MKIKIRKARKDDFEGYLILRKQTFREYKLKERKGEGKKIKDEFNNILKSPKSLLIVVESRDELVGYFIATFLSNVWNKSTYLDDISVKKEFRRKGIAYKLMRELFKQAKQKRCDNIRLGVLTGNKKALSLYKKFGFKIKHYDMEKKLK